jgi:diacylglycerol kinase (ATP)
MKKHKAKLIVNPNADLGRAWHTAGDLRPLVEELGGADWEGTGYPTHAIELTRQAAEDGYELIIAAGGDGTAHEVINGLMQLTPDKRPKLGIIPLGSGNDFAFAIGMDARPEIATRQVFTGTPKYIDVGRLEDNRGIVEYWDNAVGVGFDATVTIHSRKFTYVKGFLIYLLAVLKTIILNHDAPILKVTMDTEQFEEAMLMFVLCNGSREGGGFLVAPEAKPDDGIFHYAGIKRVSRPMMLRLVPEVMKGTHGKFPDVKMGQFHKLELQADRPLVIHMDGEIFAGFGVDVNKLSVEILPNAIQAIV